MAVWAAHHAAGCTTRLHLHHHPSAPSSSRPRGVLLPLPPRRGGASLASLAATSATATAPVRTASEEAVYEVVMRQAALVEGAAAGRVAREDRRRPQQQQRPRWAEDKEGEGLVGWGLLGDAYDRCGEVCAEYAKTFYLGQCTTLLILLRFGVGVLINCWLRSSELTSSGSISE